MTHQTLTHNVPATKRCCGCKQEKPASEFYGDKRKRDGLQGRCKPCTSIKNAEYKAKHPEYFRKQCRINYTAKYRHENAERYQKYKSEYLHRRKQTLTSIEGRLYMIFKAAQDRAKRANLPFTITREWVTNQWEIQQGKCKVTGIPITLNVNENGEKFYAPFNPSLDQIHAGRGYTPENTRLICVIVNLALNKFGDEAFDAMCRAYITNPENL